MVCDFDSTTASTSKSEEEEEEATTTIGSMKGKNDKGLLLTF